MSQQQQTMFVFSSVATLSHEFGVYRHCLPGELTCWVRAQQGTSCQDWQIGHQSLVVGAKICCFAACKQCKQNGSCIIGKLSLRDTFKGSFLIPLCIVRFIPHYPSCPLRWHGRQALHPPGGSLELNVHDTSQTSSHVHFLPAVS